MKLKISLAFLLISILWSFKTYQKTKLPKGFAYVKNEISTINVALRYATKNNFIGRQINGYHNNKAILTIEAINALKKVQKDLNELQLSLIIYDAYRPQKAVNQFVKWAKVLDDTLMKGQFYPNVAKKNLFR